MVNFNLGTPREKHVAIADLGSGSAAVGIFSIPRDGPASVLAFSRSVLSFEERQKNQTIKAIGTALEEAGEKAFAQYRASSKAPIAATYAVIHPPWTHYETTHVSTTFPEPQVISAHTIGDAAERAIGEKGLLDHDHLIETRVIRVELNGYRTGKPIGKRAKEITVAVLMSDCEEEIMTLTKDTLSKLFTRTPRLFSSTCALLTVLPEIAPRPKDYVIVDMSSEATAMIVIREGLAAEHILISEGSRSILKHVAGRSLPEEVLSILRMIARDHCQGDACDRVRAALAHLEPDLVRSIGEAMGKLANRIRLPTALTLVAMADLAPWLMQFFARIDFTQFTSTAQPFTPELLREDQLGSLVAWPQERDIGLSLAAALVNTEEKAQQ